MPRESAYQARLIKVLHDMFPGCIVLKNDPNYLQGVPDLTVLYKRHWAWLEVKESETAPHRPNQDYYISQAVVMSFGAFISPSNEREVLDGLQQAFECTCWTTCVSQS